MTYKGHKVLQCHIRARFSPRHSTGQQYIYSGCTTGRLLIFDILTGKILYDAQQHRDAVRDLSWHPYEPIICTSSWDGSIGRWEYKPPKQTEPRELRRPGLRPKACLSQTYCK
jgi:WD repeat-containing protein 23